MKFPVSSWSCLMHITDNCFIKFAFSWLSWFHHSQIRRDSFYFRITLAGRITEWNQGNDSHSMSFVCHQHKARRKVVRTKRLPDAFQTHGVKNSKMNLAFWTKNGICNLNVFLLVGCKKHTIYIVFLLACWWRLTFYHGSVEGNYQIALTPTSTRKWFSIFEI